jgi:hypothetical protein
VQASNELNFMRHRNFLISILLLSALALSGWGVVLAATLCPHAARAAAMMAATSSKTDGHSSCHAKSGTDAAHKSSPTHEAMGDMEEMSPTRGESPALSAQLAEGCRPCCVSHSNLPTAPVNPREAQPGGREKQHAASQDVKTIAPAVAAFVPTVVPTQGSPPGQLVRRHLLLSVFII